MGPEVGPETSNQKNHIYINDLENTLAERVGFSTTAPETQVIEIA
jgi:hypothetical protein